MNKEEKERIIKKTEQILNALRTAGLKGLTNSELSKIALRYGGSLGELYKKGYTISKESLGEGLYRYWLVSEPSVEAVREKAIDVLLSNVKSFGLVDAEQLLSIMNNSNIAVKYKANTYK